MVTLTWFESEQDLQALTGLSHDELWDAGFDLDDWDFGFVCDRELNIQAYAEEDFDCGYFHLIKALCTFLGFSAPSKTHTVYNGKHYYMSYHS